MGIQSKGMFVSYKTIAVIILAALLVLTVVQNMGNATMRFLMFRFSAPVIVLVVGSFILGGVAGAILARRKKG